jgi:hypothetical protein
MKIESIWAELEQDLAWRHDELRLLSNTRNSLKREVERDRFRRAQLVMLYAHVEGFCKLAFLIYIKAINTSGTSTSSASNELVASAFSDLFHALQHGDEKGKVFSSKLPTDPKLHIVARRRDFVAEYDAILRRRIEIPDTAVNTESNLGSIVMRRNLFRLGFPEDRMAEYDQSLDELVNRRNNIAHGSDDAIVKATDYDRLQRTVFRAMDELALVIVEAIDQSSYLYAGVPRLSEAWLVGEMK